MNESFEGKNSSARRFFFSSQGVIKLNHKSVFYIETIFFLHRLYLYSVSVFLSLLSFFVSVSTY